MSRVRPYRLKALSALALALIMLTACGAEQKSAASEDSAVEITQNEQETVEEPVIEAADEIADEEKESEKMLKLMIGDAEVSVEWEDNQSVTALRELCGGEPLRVEMSMYGGFEQVGPLGASLPRNDRQTTTQAGDIVLYSGNQIVVFYGSNSWSYTRLGHITGLSVSDLEALLGNGDVTLTISME